MALRDAFSLRRNVGLLLGRRDDHLAAVDGLRALSILWVIAFHTVGVLSNFLDSVSVKQMERAVFSHLPLRWMAAGDLGVDVFFVISGFLIARMLLAERAERGRSAVGRFYARRALRLLPAYAVALLLACAVAPQALHCQNAWANVLYVNNFLPWDQQCMSWSWSLAIEEQFYLLFPLVLPFLFRFRSVAAFWLVLAVLVSVLVGALIARRTGVDLPLPSSLDEQTGAAWLAYMDVLYDKPYVRCGALLCGVWVAQMRAFTGVEALLERHPRGAQALLVLTVALGAAAASFSLFDPRLAALPAWARAAYLAAWRTGFSACVAVALLVTLAAGIRWGPRAWVARALESRALYPVAQLSYSMYLLHPLAVVGLYTAYRALGMLGPAVSAVDLAWMFPVNVAASVLVSAPLYLLVERPIMSLRR